MSKGNFNRGCIGDRHSITSHPGEFPHMNNHRGSPREKFGGRGPSPVEIIANGLADMPIGLRILLVTGLIAGGYGNIIGKLFEGYRDNGGTYVRSQNNCGPVITAARVGIEAVEAVQQLSNGVVFEDNTPEVDLTETAKETLATYCQTRGGKLVEDFQKVSAIVRNAIGIGTDYGEEGVKAVMNAMTNIVGGVFWGAAQGCSEDGSTVTPTPTATLEATSPLVPDTFCKVPPVPLACEHLNPRIVGIDEATGEPLILNPAALSETETARKIVLDYHKELPASNAPQLETPYHISENIYIKGDQGYWNDLLGQNALRVVGDVLRSSSNIWLGLSKQFEPNLYSSVNNDFDTRDIIIVFTQGQSVIYGNKLSIVKNPDTNAFDPISQAISFLERSSEANTEPYKSATIWINGAYIVKGFVLPVDFPKIRDPVINYKLSMANEIGGLYMDILGRTPAYKATFIKILEFYNQKYGTGLDIETMTFEAQRDLGSTFWMLETLEQMIQNGEISKRESRPIVWSIVQKWKSRV